MAVSHLFLVPNGVPSVCMKPLGKPTTLPLDLPTDGTSRSLDRSLVLLLDCATAGTRTSVTAGCLAAGWLTVGWRLLQAKLSYFRLD